MYLKRFALSSLCIYFFCFWELPAQQYGADDIHWPSARMVEYKALLSQAEALYYAHPSRARTQLQQALALAELQQDDFRAVRVRIMLAKLSERSPQGNAHLRREALNEFLEVLRICTRLQDTACQAEALFHIGMGYGHFEDYEQAVPYLLKALPRFAVLGDTTQMVQTYMHIGQFFQEQDMIPSAIEFSHQALNLARATESDSVRAWALRLVGRLHLVHKEGGAALSYLEEARHLAEEVLPARMVIAPTYEAGQAAYLQGDIPLAQAYFQKAASLSRQHEDSRGLAESNLGLVEVYRQRGLLPAALQTAEATLVLAQTNGYTSLEQRVFHQLRDIYQLMGQNEMAERYGMQAERLTNALDTRRMQEQLQKVRSRFAVQEMEDALKLAAEKEASARADLERKRWQTGFALALGLSFMILAIVLFKQYRRKQRANSWLEAEVAARTRDLSDANERLHVVNEELDRLAYRTAHDVRGPLARVLGLAQVAADTEELSMMQTYIGMLGDEARQMDHLLRQFMEVNHVKHLPVERDFVALKPLLQEIFETCRQWPDFARFTTEIRCPEVRVKLHRRALETILQQVLHNSLRFAHEKVPVCSVHVLALPEGLEILVIDNGQAIPVEVQPHLFEMFRKGEDPRAGLGLGLYIAKLAAAHMGADLSYVPQARPGSVFRLFLPNLAIEMTQATTEQRIMMPLES